MNKKVKCKHDIYAGACYFCKELPKYEYLKTLNKGEARAMVENNKKVFNMCINCNKESRWCHDFCTKCHYKWKIGNISHPELGPYKEYMEKKKISRELNEKFKEEDDKKDTDLKEADDQGLSPSLGLNADLIGDEDYISEIDVDSTNPNNPGMVTIIINTTEYPELYEKLKESAKLHVRPISYQILKYTVDGLKAEGFVEEEKEKES